jgi:hypothetical protein
LIATLLPLLALRSGGADDRERDRADVAPEMRPRSSGVAQAGIPELPRDTVDTRIVASSGDTLRVAPGGNVQRAIDRARPGDVILLTPGGEYSGPVRLRRKAGAGWITIRSAAADSLFAVPGTRVSPEAAPALPRIRLRRPMEPAISTEEGAAYYRLIGLEIAVPREMQRTGTLIQLGAGADQQRDTSGIPHHIILDRLLVHGHDEAQVQRCVALNSAWTAVIDSHLGACHARGFESQAIAGWNGPGPFKIVNNHLEGAGMSILFGGALSLPGLIPSDIEIRRNYMFKPPSWRRVWVVKNALELKTGRRVLIEGNVMDGSWVHGQVGFGLVMTSMGAGGQTWHSVQDVTVRYNVIRNVGSGVNLGAVYAGASTPTQRVAFSHNLIYDVNTPEFSGDGRLFQILGAVRDVRIERNTVVGGRGRVNQAMVFDGAPAVRLVVRNNIFTRGRYGVFGSGSSEGNPTLARFAPGLTWDANLLIGTKPAAPYPSGTRFAREGEMRFANPEGGDFSPGPGSRGAGLGADLITLRRLTQGVVTAAG